MAIAAAQPASAPQSDELSASKYYQHLNAHKFTVELEFLSSLASPSYLTHLYAQGHLHDPAFIHYVAHIVRTWSKPQYVCFLRFPNALLFARAIVQSPAFRQAVGLDGWEQELTRELIADWAGQTATYNATHSHAQNNSTDQQQGNDEQHTATSMHGALGTPTTVKQEHAQQDMIGGT